MATTGIRLEKLIKEVKGLVEEPGLPPFAKGHYMIMLADLERALAVYMLGKTFEAREYAGNF